MRKPPGARGGRPARMLALVALGQFLGMTLWFSATAAAPRIAGDLGLTTVQTAWLTIAVQGGFVIGTLVSAVLNLADVFNARRLFAVGCAVGAAANAAVATTGDAAAILILRFVTGAAWRSAWWSAPSVSAPGSPIFWRGLRRTSHGGR